MFGRRKKKYEEAEKCLQKMNEMAQANGFDGWESYCESIEKKKQEENKEKAEEKIQNAEEFGQEAEDILDILKDVEKTIENCERTVKTCIL